MTEELLQGADVGAVLEQVRGEGMSKGVTARPLGDSRGEHGLTDGLLHYGFVEVMAPLLAALALDVATGRRKHPLPGPVAAGGGELPRERSGKLDPTGTLGEIALVLVARAVELRGAARIGLFRAAS